LRQRVLLYRGSRFTRSPGFRWVLCHGLGLCRLGIVAIVVTVMPGQLVQLFVDALKLSPSPIFAVAWVVIRAGV
jgi:uncharacterized SAM-binding protein YcdF (DUF218 family)